MNRVQILDCTLRDGGYINNWKFGQNTIHGIIKNLMDAHVNIIECGFIRKSDSDVNSTVFSSMEDFAERIKPKSKGTQYAVMIEQHNYNADLICPCTENTADLIRLTFRRKEWEEAKIAIKSLIKKGYKVCVQPVGTAAYDDPSLINLIEDVNEIRPYAFYLVDTLGVMYRHEMRKFFYLIDNNLSQDILLGFHSHNNLQMSFANAQEMMRLNRNRSIIIDSSCYGMGRGVGNLSTELIADYINNNMEQRYLLTPILNIVDKYLMPIYAQQRWGYDLPYFLSATFKCHPNYAAHLLKKDTLSVEKIEKILSLIPLEKRSEYNKDFIENLYLSMQACDLDDTNSYLQLETLLNSKDVMIIGSGASIVSYKNSIEKMQAGKVSIATNFVPSDLDVNAVFISNQKRLENLKKRNVTQIIATSNLKSEIKNAIFFNYSSLLGEGDLSDAAGAMLIRILRKCNVKKIYIAGFDGFDVDSSVNYAVPTLKKSLDYDSAKKKNDAISKQLTLALNGVEYEFITPTKYRISSF